MEYNGYARPDELAHWGIKGMKWGVRRYQNKDGSLTAAGKKRRAKLEGELEKLGGKKASASSDSKSASDEKVVKKPQARDMSDGELQNVVNRLRNEDAYRDLSKKLGYDTPATELDAKIADMKKQKEYLELQRDIAKLTPQKTSRGKQFVNKLIDDALIPAVTDSVKATVKKYLTDTGVNTVAELLGKEATKAKANADKAAQKAQDKADKKTAKQEAKKSAETETTNETSTNTKTDKSSNSKNEGTKSSKTESKVYEGEVVGEGTSRRQRTESARSSSKDTVIDAEWTDINVSDVPATVTNRGQSYIAGLLEERKD